MSIYVDDPILGRLVPHYFKGSGTLPDRFGKTEGYRCSETNKSDNGVFYRDLKDVADHLKANSDWGVRVTKPGEPPSLRMKHIVIDGVPR